MTEEIAIEKFAFGKKGGKTKTKKMPKRVERGGKAAVAFGLGLTGLDQNKIAGGSGSLGVLGKKFDHVGNSIRLKSGVGVEKEEILRLGVGMLNADVVAGRKTDVFGKRGDKFYCQTGIGGFEPSDF